MVAQGCFDIGVVKGKAGGLEFGRQDFLASQDSIGKFSQGHLDHEGGGRHKAGPVQDFPHCLS